MFKLNLKIALRNLWKHKSYTLINIGGLAIGLASCMVLLLYVAFEWGYDRQSKNYENTYIVYNHQNSSSGMMSDTNTPSVLAKELKEKVPGVVAVSRCSDPEEHVISYKNNVFKKNILFTDPAFLQIQDYHFLRGNPKQALLGVHNVVITAHMAKSLFGQHDPIGKTLIFDNSIPLRVEAVIADLPKNSSIQFDYLAPWQFGLQLYPKLEKSGWESNFCMTVVQLQPGAGMDQHAKVLRQIHDSHYDDHISNFTFFPLSRLHLYNDFKNGKSVGGKIDQIRIFFFLAFCILLIACVNFMNLSTARSEKRSKEVGVRKAIGSTRWALVSQFMLESLLLALFGMVLAFVMLELSLPYFNGLLKTELQINYADWKFLGAFISLTVLTGLVAGSYPAFYLSSFSPLQVLKGFKSAGKASLSVRQVLVVFQFVFAACLIVCTAVIYQQLNYIKDKSTGYNKNNLVEVDIQGPLIGNLQKLLLLKEQLLKSGAASDVTFFSTRLTQGGNNTFGVFWPGKNEKEETIFNIRAVGYDFVKTMRNGLVGGREFSPLYPDTTGVMVNEAAIKVMGLKNPVGSKINFWGREVTIIGVMKDFVIESPYSETRAMLLYRNNDNLKEIVIRLNAAAGIGTSIKQITALTEQFNPGFPTDIKFVDGAFEEKFQNEQLLGTVANWFAGFAIFISCLGLLGLALFVAEQRKKEISIRKVLGASHLNIITLLNKDFIKLVAIANVIAFPLAYILINHWLSAYSFRVRISFLPFGIALLLSVLIAVLTVSIQSFKVAKGNPADALKYE